MLGKISNAFGKAGGDGRGGKARVRSLGWRIGQNAEYNIDLPPLSAEEEELVLEVENAFREAAGNEQIEEGSVERELSGAVSRQADIGHIALDSEQRSYLAKYAKMHIYGFAFLDELVSDDSIEEISVIGIGKPAYVFVRKTGWKKVNACFEDEKVLMDVINKMARGIGRRITLQNPRLDAMLPGGSRLHASLPPVSAGELTIRKFRQKPFSPKELVELGTADWKMMAFLSMLMQTDSSVMIAGNTASGKTTTLNALFSFVKNDERIIVTEETPEISIPHEHQVRLVANRDMGLALKDLVYDSLRMRPDRMIVGEVRNKEEVEALFDVLLGGQARGAYATFHAQSAEEARLRLGKFGVDSMDLGSIDAIVVQRRMLAYDKRSKRWGEIRKIVGVSEGRGGGKDMAALSTHSGNNWRYSWCGLCERVAGAFDMDRKEMGAELASRERWLKASPGEYMQFFESAQERLYKGKE